MIDRIAELHARRLQRWRQTPADRIAGPREAAALIDALGFATLYPASPEVPNLFHAFTGDPAATPESSWDSPSGHVYGWRWELGHAAAAFYTAWVRGKPTWVGWGLLPAVLRLRAATRDAGELHAAGHLSDDALRVAEALADAGSPLATGDLRRIAGFPTGKAERAAYLKAVDELEGHMILAKLFTPGETDMRHALITSQYPEQSAAAAALSRGAAFDQLLQAYLPGAVYALPEVLARHVRLPADELRAALDRAVERGLAAPLALDARRQAYVAQGA